MWLLHLVQLEAARKAHENGRASLQFGASLSPVSEITPPTLMIPEDSSVKPHFILTEGDVRHTVFHVPHMPGFPVQSLGKVPDRCMALSSHLKTHQRATVSMCVAKAPDRGRIQRMSAAGIVTTDTAALTVSLLQPMSDQ